MRTITATLEPIGRRSSDTLGQPMRAVVSSEAVARDGGSVLASGWRTERFMANPVLLDSHRYDVPPVGTVTDVHVDKQRRLVAELRFDSSNDEHARLLEKKYINGIMHSFSVGFSVLRMADRGQPLPDGRAWPEGASWVATETELQDVSTVAMPSDVNATLIRGATAAAAVDADAQRWAYGIARRWAPAADARHLARLTGRVLAAYRAARSGLSRDKAQQLLEGAADDAGGHDKAVLLEVLDRLNDAVQRQDQAHAVATIKQDLHELLAR